MGNKHNRSNHLSDQEVQVLASVTGYSEDEIRDYHRDFLTDYRDGQVDRREFVQLFERFFRHGNSDRYADFAFQLFDADQNRKLSFSEFVLATSFLKQDDCNEHQRLDLIFSAYDIDGIEKISRRDVERLYEAAYYVNGRRGHARHQVNEIFQKYDRDGSGNLTKKEFLYALHQEQFLSLCQF